MGKEAEFLKVQDFRKIYPGPLRKVIPYPGQFVPLEGREKGEEDMDLEALKKTVGGLKKMVSEEDLEVVDVNLARAPEQNYARRWKKWRPAGVPDGAETTYGPGLYEAYRPDIMKELVSLAKELEDKYPMRKPGEEEPPEYVRDAKERVRQVVAQLRLPEAEKNKILMQLMKHEYVRGWDRISDHRGLMQHVNAMGFKYGGFGVISEMVERLKKCVLEHCGCEGEWGVVKEEEEEEGDEEAEERWREEELNSDIEFIFMELARKLAIFFERAFPSEKTLAKPFVVEVYKKIGKIGKEFFSEMAAGPSFPAATPMDKIEVLLSNEMEHALNKYL